MMKIVAAILIGLVPALLAFAGPSINWSGPQDIQIGIGGAPPPPVYVHWEMDLDINSIADFIFDYVVPGPDLVLTTQGSNRNTGPLAPGTSIDSSLTWSTGQQTMAIWRELLGDDTGCAGPWCGVSNGYMGLEFDIDGSIHYGWARITVYESSPGAVIHDWAYETEAGVAIAAGVVPEPTTLALLLLGSLYFTIRKARTIGFRLSVLRCRTEI